MIHTVKGFKAEVDVFLELSCSLMIQRILAIWSLVPLPFLNPAWTSGSLWFTYCWSLTWRILNVTSLWYECNCAVVSAFFGIAFLGLEWKLTFSSPVATAEFSKFVGILSAALWQHHLLGFERNANQNYSDIYHLTPVKMAIIKKYTNSKC